MPTAVLVEGESDRNAVETLATRLGRDLAGEGVTVTAMGGATNIRRHLAALEGVRTCGLYDAKEERFFRRALGTEDLERAGFFRCEQDLEDELIRALGVDRVLEVVEARGELASYRILQRQPFHRGRPERAQLRRFLGTHSGRKIEYGGLLAAALDLDRLPRPLAALLDVM